MGWAKTFGIKPTSQWNTEEPVYLFSLCVPDVILCFVVALPPNHKQHAAVLRTVPLHTVHGTGKRREEKTGPADDKQSKRRKKKNCFLMFIFFSSTSNYCANKLLKSEVTTESITCFFLNYTFHLFVTRSLEKTGKLMILNLRRRMEEFFTKFTP